jgi:hypothetical protein
MDWRRRRGKSLGRCRDATDWQRHRGGRDWWWCQVGGIGGGVGVTSVRRGVGKRGDVAMVAAVVGGSGGWHQRGGSSGGGIGVAAVGSKGTVGGEFV